MRLGPERRWEHSQKWRTVKDLNAADTKKARFRGLFHHFQIAYSAGVGAASGAGAAWRVAWAAAWLPGPVPLAMSASMRAWTGA